MAHQLYYRSIVGNSSGICRQLHVSLLQQFCGKNLRCLYCHQRTALRRSSYNTVGADNLDGILHRNGSNCGAMHLSGSQCAFKNSASRKGTRAIVYSDIAICFLYCGQRIGNTVLTLLAAGYYAKRQRPEIIFLIACQKLTAFNNLLRRQHDNGTLNQTCCLQHMQTVHQKRCTVQHSKGLINPQPQTLTGACGRNNYNKFILTHLKAPILFLRKSFFRQMSAARWLQQQLRCGR